MPAHLLGATLCLLSIAIAGQVPLNEHVPYMLCLYVAMLLPFVAVLSNPSSGRLRRLFRAGPTSSVILLWALAIRLPFVMASPSLSDDINRYTFEARTVLSGEDPYDVAPDSIELAELSRSSPEWPAINHKELPAIYPPGTQWALSAIVAVSDSQRFMRVVFTVLDLALIVVLLLLLRQTSADRARVLLYAWHPLPALEISGSGHFEPLAILPMLLGFYLWRRGSKVWAWLLWGASLSSKFVGGVPALFAALLALRERGLTAASMGLALAAAPVLILAIPFALDGSVPLGSLSHYANHWGNFPAVFGMFSAAVGYHPARWLCLALVLLWTVRVVRKGLEPAQAFMQFFAGLLLLSPVVHPWYGLWLLVLVPLYPSLALFVLSSLLPFAYLAWTQQHQGGPWLAPVWAQWLVYGLPALLLVWQEWRARS